MLENGALLEAAEAAGFDVLVTTDKNQRVGRMTSRGHGSRHRATPQLSSPGLTGRSSKRRCLWIKR
jgi:hypothetical protein